ncbi:DUF4383 domain-containing protein [uncultured Jatrophihabitans sp.]|uniref:DUF4383 domain-containing protein n=1 Tax=uncultured Jatrophihabitans sp. TaxID=1610747 RepID=UPI0035C9E059
MTSHQIDLEDDAGNDDFDELYEPIIGPLSLQAITLGTAAVFMVVGILGFLPGVTSDLSFHNGPRFSGHHSHAMLFGVFMVSVLHNFVHLGYAALGAVSSFFAQTVRVYFIAGGVIYLVVWLYGLIVREDSSANFLPVNTADNWLHFGLGVGMIAIGILLHLRLRAARDRVSPGAQ